MAEAMQAGWYPDPTGRHEYRHWDGATWTPNVSDQGVTATDALSSDEANLVPPVAAGGSSTPSPPAAPQSVTRKSDDERKALLAQVVSSQLALGDTRVETQSDYQAVIVQGKPINHVLHLLLTIFTCGVWGIVWLILAVGYGEKRRMLTVDEWGNTSIASL